MRWRAELIERLPYMLWPAELPRVDGNTQAACTCGLEEGAEWICLGKPNLVPRQVQSDERRRQSVLDVLVTFVDQRRRAITIQQQDRPDTRVVKTVQHRMRPAQEFCPAHAVGDEAAWRQPQLDVVDGLLPAALRVDWSRMSRGPYRRPPPDPRARGGGRRRTALSTCSHVGEAQGCSLALLWLKVEVEVRSHYAGFLEGAHPTLLRSRAVDLVLLPGVDDLKFRIAQEKIQIRKLIVEEVPPKSRITWDRFRGMPCPFLHGYQCEPTRLQHSFEFAKRSQDVVAFHVHQYRRAPDGANGIVLKRQAPHIARHGMDTQLVRRPVDERGGCIESNDVPAQGSEVAAHRVRFPSQHPAPSRSSAPPAS